MLISQELLVQFTSNLDSVWVRVCPTTRWHHFHGDYVMGCIWAMKCIQDIFLAEKTPISGKDTTWNV